MKKKINQPIYLILQNIRSLYNIGSLFRTADGLGVNKIYLCGYTATPPRPEISKTALGAENSVPWEKCRQTLPLIKKLKTAGIKIVALEITPQAIDLDQIKPTGPVALILGNEVTGITKPILAAADVVAKIPMNGVKESFNVAVAGGIALYELRRSK